MSRRLHPQPVAKLTVTYRLDPVVDQAVRDKAIADGTTLTAIVEAALRTHLGLTDERQQLTV